MATTRRRQSLAVIDQLRAEPWRYEFLQAVRLLEAAVCSPTQEEFEYADQSVGGLAPPNRELLHFYNQASLAFSTSNVADIDEQDVSGTEAERQWTMTLRCFGLAGSHGVLPHYFSEILLLEARRNNRTLEHFTNVFEHRSISLYLQASRKYFLPLQYEQARRGQHRKEDLFSETLTALIGLGTPRITDKLEIPKSALLGYAGLYARNIRSAAALKAMLQDYFDLDTEIEQFCGQWQELPADIVTRLGGDGSGMPVNCELGVNTILGERCWQAQSKFRIRMAPVDYDSFMELAPGSKKMKALQSFVEYFSGSELDYEICIEFDWRDAQPAQLTKEVGQEPLLGWNTPLGMIEDASARDPIDIMVSKHTSPPDAGLATIQ